MDRNVYPLQVFLRTTSQSASQTAPLVGEPLAKRRSFTECQSLPSIGATATTAASGGNREELLGPRPAGCERQRSRRWEPQPGQWHGKAVTERFDQGKTKAPHSKAAGRIDHAPRSAERTFPATARPGCWRYKIPQAVSSDLPGTPEALPFGELAAKQTERAIKGYTSSRKSLGVSFFEENAAVPTHRRCTLLSVKR